MGNGLYMRQQGVSQRRLLYTHRTAILNKLVSEPPDQRLHSCINVFFDICEIDSSDVRLTGFISASNFLSCDGDTATPVSIFP
jgi:hypothetical protein